MNTLENRTRSNGNNGYNIDGINDDKMIIIIAIIRIVMINIMIDKNSLKTFKKFIFLNELSMPQCSPFPQRTHRKPPLKREAFFQTRRSITSRGGLAGRGG